MATCSSLLAWRVPWTEKPDGLRSIELQIVGHDFSDLSDMTWHACMHTRYSTKTYLLNLNFHFAIAQYIYIYDTILKVRYCERIKNTEGMY